MKHATHDFLAFRQWIFAVGGFSVSSHPLYRIYQAFLVLYTLYMQAAALYGAYLSYPQKEYTLRAGHTFLISIFATYVLGQRLTITETIKKMHQTVTSGIYQYEEDYLAGYQRKLFDNVAGEITFKSNAWFCMLGCGSAYTLVVFPVTQFFLVGEEEYRSIPYVVNPFLPNCFWSPHNRSPGGFVIMFLNNVTIIFLTYLLATCQNQIYLSCNVQLRVHLKVLNHSIVNIERRAYVMFLDSYKHTLEESTRAAMFRNGYFQECMCSCLRANILHHQALIRFKNECQPFNGAMLFILVTLCALMYANVFCLVLQHPSPNYLLMYILTFLVENCYTFYQCIFGQDILDQSGELFHSLYQTPWLECNRKFNRMVDVMMCMTIKPIKLKAYLFDFTASFETYAERFSLMYSIVNVLR